MKAPNNQMSQKSFCVSACVIDKKNDQYLIEFNRCENNKDNSNRPKYCCGGYCGSTLWKKMLPTQKPNYCKLPQQYPVGSYLKFTINPLKILLIQSLIWLLPTIVFLLVLSIFAEGLETLLIAFLIAMMSWYFLQKLMKNPFLFVKLTDN